MKTIARFVVRPGDLKSSLMVGLRFAHGKTEIVENVVYEIVECLGSLMIRPVGESCFGATLLDYKDRDPLFAPEGVWGHCISHVISCNNGEHFMTQEELALRRTIAAQERRLHR